MLTNYRSALLQVKGQVHVSSLYLSSRAQGQEACSWVCSSHGKMQEQNRAGRNLLCFVKLQLGIGISSLLPIFLWLEQMICLMSVDQENILHPEGEGGREGIFAEK